MAAVPILQGCTVVLAGTLSPYSHETVKRMIEIEGGQISETVHDQCTHIIAGVQRLSRKPGKKSLIGQALNIPGISLVSLEWLITSIYNQVREDEQPYTLLLDIDGGTQPIDILRKASDVVRPVPVDSSKKKRALDSGGGANEGLADEASSKPNKKVKQEPPTASDQQKILPPTPVVPPDDASPFKDTHTVYVQKDGTVWDATLNQTNSSNNNNKYYILQILIPLQSNHSIILWSRWGRVGERGQKREWTCPRMCTAISEFNSRFWSKTGLSWEKRYDPPKPGKYTFVERNYEDSDDEDEPDEPPAKTASGGHHKIVPAEPPESKLAPEVQDLIRLIFNIGHFQATMATISYDVNKLPLGKLSQRTVKNGFLILKSIAEILTGSMADSGRQLELLSNQYFSVIPHVFGRLRPPILDTTQMVQKEVELLDTLTDMGIAAEIMQVASKVDHRVNPLDRQFAGLHLNEMTPLSHDSNEFLELKNYLVNTCGRTHYIKYDLKHIFRLEREGEKERFQNSPYANLPNSDRRLLWHGSRTSNYGGILSQGLRIAPPEAPSTGYMFGKGIYFADMSSKSANYCHSIVTGNIGLLLLCEVELGNPMYEPKGCEYGAGESAKEQGKISTLGRGAVRPKSWKDAGCVHESLKGISIPDLSQQPEEGISNSLAYNEYIVYDIAQVRQRYLLFTKIGH